MTEKQLTKKITALWIEYRSEVLEDNQRRLAEWREFEKDRREYYFKANLIAPLSQPPISGFTFEGFMEFISQKAGSK